MSSRCEKWSKRQFKQFACFILFTYGMTFLLWPFRYFGGENAYLFSRVIVLLPALGAMVAVRLTAEESSKLPKKYHFFFGAVALVSLGIAMGAVIAPEHPWAEASMVISQIMALVGWGVLLFENKQCRIENGLSWNRVSAKVTIGMIGLFCLLYFGRIGVSLFLGGGVQSFQQIMVNGSFAMVYLLQLLPYFFLSYLSFFGEEYGWRFFLQPLMQKRFGTRVGILLAGVLWGIWHIPMILIPSNSGSWVLIVLTQCIVCVCLGAFLGWVYLKTSNVWLVAFLHYLSNQFSLLFLPASRVGALDVNALSQLGMVFLINVCYCVPLFLKRKNSQ